MNEKIVFFDIDGTLVDHDKNFLLSTKQAIEELKKNNVSVVLATGRPPFLYEDIREELGINSYISFNGQHVVFEGKTIYENPMKEQELKRLHEATMAHDYPMVFISDTEMRATVDENPYVWETHKKLTDKYPVVDPLFYLKKPIFQSLLYCIDDEENVFKDNHEAFYFQRWHKYSCDIIPEGGSKAVGVEKILEVSGLNKENSFAFGDGINDMEMMEAIGTSIAMGNSIAELKSIADYVTDDVDQEGVINALLKYKLI